MRSDYKSLFASVATLIALLYVYSVSTLAFFKDKYTFPDVPWNTPDCSTLLTCTRGLSSWSCGLVTSLLVWSDHIQYGVGSSPVWHAGTDAAGWIFALSFFFIITLFVSQMVRYLIACNDDCHTGHLFAENSVVWFDRWLLSCWTHSSRSSI